MNVRAALVGGLVACACVSACQTPQKRISEEQALGRYDQYFEEYSRELDRLEEVSQQRLMSEARSSTPAEPQVFDVLVLSGGGAFGAFGAGFLQGWGECETSTQRRPAHFDSVSGISTGALIAPFAFVGTDAAYQQIVDLYRNPGRDWVRKRGIIPYLPGNVSVFDVSRLKDQIRASITPELMQQVASGGREGRQLQIGTTNVDYGMLRIWDLAALPDGDQLDVSTERAVDILFASSAIPGAFPPVLIDDLLYVDGGAAMQFVGGVDRQAWLFEDAPADIAVDNELPIQIRVWVIINQKLLPEPTVVRTRWTSVAARSLSTLLRTSTLQSLDAAETYVRLLDRQPGFDAEFRFVAIPQEFELGDSDDMFDAETMRRLVDLGRDMGRVTTSWRTRAPRPGAPFRDPHDTASD